MKYKHATFMLSLLTSGTVELENMMISAIHCHVTRTTLRYHLYIYTRVCIYCHV